MSPCYLFDKDKLKYLFFCTRGGVFPFGKSTDITRFRIPAAKCVTFFDHQATAVRYSWATNAVFPGRTSFQGTFAATCVTEHVVSVTYTSHYLNSSLGYRADSDDKHSPVKLFPHTFSTILRPVRLMKVFTLARSLIFAPLLSLRKK